ncbi:MAG: hypothetical protein CMF46_03095 [Legionellales bacterium]|nr:hypothetical protein [Legionellales bacterium]|tara:strand:- start:607 stop:1026 length:420 start_codon:yes stop_codon:yes gene_type:complete
MRNQPDQFAYTAEILSKARQEKNLSIHDIADQLGIASTRVQHFESNEFDSLDIISTKQLKAYIELLGIRCDIPVNKKILRPISIEFDEPMMATPKLNWKTARKYAIFAIIFIITSLFTYQDIIKQYVSNNQPTVTTQQG